MNELALFAGIGGGILATKHFLGWRTVCYVENGKYQVEVLKARIRDGYLDDAPIWDNAFTFDGHPWAGLVDVITAGFPCQPFSLAGKRLAEDDPRNGWPAIIRIIREVRPRYVFLENVPGLLSKPYYRRILGELAEASFDIEQDCISAAEMGAPHRRNRLWIVAHARSEQYESNSSAERRQGANELSAHSAREQIIIQQQPRKEDIQPAGDGDPQSMADTKGKGLAHRRQSTESEEAGKAIGTEAFARSERRGDSWWATEPRLGRVADGVAHRVDRLEAIGNGQVPAVVEEAWNRLKSA